MDGQRHEEAADQKDAGIESAKIPFQVDASLAKAFGETHAVDGIGDKQGSEKENFRGEEQPHAERDGLTLLVGGLELVRDGVQRLGDRLGGWM